MASGFVVRKNEYYDSVFLMRIAKTLNEEPGVRQSAAVMATEANKGLLADIGIAGVELEQAGPNDLVVAVLSEAPAIVERLLSTLDERLGSFANSARPSSYRSLAGVLLFPSNAQAARFCAKLVLASQGAYHGA